MRRFLKPRRMQRSTAIPSIRVMEGIVRRTRLGRHREDSGTALDGSQGRVMAVVKQEKRIEHCGLDRHEEACLSGCQQQGSSENKKSDSTATSVQLCVM